MRDSPFCMVFWSPRRMHDAYTFAARTLGFPHLLRAIYGSLTKGGIKSCQQYFYAYNPFSNRLLNIVHPMNSDAGKRKDDMKHGASIYGEKSLILQRVIVPLHWLKNYLL